MPIVGPPSRHYPFKNMRRYQSVAHGCATGLEVRYRSRGWPLSAQGHHL